MGTRPGNKWLSATLVEAAGSVGRMKGKNYLAAQHARLTARRGMSRAQVAVAHSILVSAYYMLLRDEPYRDLGADWLAQRNDEAHTRRLVAQLEKLGHNSPWTNRPPDQRGDNPRADARLQLTHSRVCVPLDLGASPVPNGRHGVRALWVGPGIEWDDGRRAFDRCHDVPGTQQNPSSNNVRGRAQGGGRLALRFPGCGRRPRTSRSFPNCRPRYCPRMCPFASS